MLPSLKLTNFATCFMHNISHWHCVLYRAFDPTHTLFYCNAFFPVRAMIQNSQYLFALAPRFTAILITDVYKFAHRSKTLPNLFYL